MNDLAFQTLLQYKFALLPTKWSNSQIQNATAHLVLKLNADKSEVVMLGTAHQLRSAAAISTIDVAGSTQAEVARRDARLAPPVR